MAPGNRKNPERAESSESTYSLMEFVADFPDDETCLNWLWRTRYAEDGIHTECAKCETVRPFKRYETTQQRQSWTCTACGSHIHPTAGTIFHKSSTSLHLWFYAMYLMTSTRCGISAKQLERELGVTYKTAWRMFNLIRNELMYQDDDDTLSGEVEIDETYVGGKARAFPKRTRAEHWARKTPVFGMVERSGKVRATVMPHTGNPYISTTVKSFVLSESIIYTDEAGYYDDIARQGYPHRRIRHRDRIYVSGTVHTNTIEGFFSLVKNGLRGVYHSVSAKWLQGYLNEYAWRYNHRDDQRRAQFLTLLLRAAAPS